jgi:hypothetical protein
MPCCSSPSFLGLSLRSVEDGLLLHAQGYDRLRAKVHIGAASSSSAAPRPCPSGIRRRQAHGLALHALLGAVGGALGIDRLLARPLNANEILVSLMLSSVAAHCCITCCAPEGPERLQFPAPVMFQYDAMIPALIAGRGECSMLRRWRASIAA